MARKGLNIYKRKDGRWEGRYKSGYTSEGKVKYTSVYGKSYLTVKAVLEEKRFNANKGIVSCSSTIGELLGVWLSDLKNRIKETTHSNYQMKLQKHILPSFSGMKYDMLTAERLNLFIRSKLDSGLSEKYVSDIAVMLKTFVKYCSRTFGYANRIENVTLPKSRAVNEKPLLKSSEQQKLRYALIKSNSLSDLGILIASATGVRIGELCGLKWSDIDFEKSIMTVRRTVQRIQNVGRKGTRLIIGTPKSTASKREIPLPDFMLQYLRKAYAIGDNYILSNSDKPIEPRTMQYRFKSLLKRLNLSQVNFHQLRHQFATGCIEAGVDVKTLSEILGHSSVEMTLNRYVHSSTERKRACMKMYVDTIMPA